MKELKSFIPILREAGVRITPQRTAVCEALCKTDSHPTAFEVYEIVRKQYPALSLMTVYNTLNLLVELGAINELGPAGDDCVHYDADTRPHINLACVKCNQILDMTIPAVSGLNQEVSEASGFRLLGARMMYYGICPNCANSTD